MATSEGEVNNIIMTAYDVSATGAYGGAQPQQSTFNGNRWICLYTQDCHRRGGQLVYTSH
eukprot:scaffold650976_cov43-Prasinocladus_malaysianus.AAC.1